MKTVAYICPHTGGVVTYDYLTDEEYMEEMNGPDSCYLEYYLISSRTQGPRQVEEPDHPPIDEISSDSFDWALHLHEGGDSNEYYQWTDGVSSTLTPL